MLNPYQSIITKQCNGMKQDEYLIKMRPFVRNLRNQFRPEGVNIDYSDTDNRQAYMLAYYPYYIQQLYDILVKTSIDFENNSTLETCFFGVGPAPEVLGLVSYLEKYRPKTQLLKTYLFDKYIHTWQNEIEITQSLVSQNWSGQLQIKTFASDIFNLKLLTCDEFNVINSSHFFVMQNCFNDLVDKPKELQENIISLFEQMPPNSIFAITDLPYGKIKEVMQKIENDTTKTLGSSLSTISYYESKNDLIEKPNNLKILFTGEDRLIAKGNTKYYALVLQRKDYVLSRTNRKTNGYISENAELQARTEPSNQQNEMFENESNKINADLSRKTHELNQLVDELGQVKEQYTQLQHTLDKVTKDFLISENQAKRLHDELEQAKQLEDKLRTEIKAIELSKVNATNQLATELRQVKQDRTRLQRDVDIANDGLSTNKNRIARLNQELSEANQEVQRLKKEIDAVQTTKQQEITQLRTQIEILQGNFETTQISKNQQVDDLNNQIQHLLTQVDTVVASNNEQVTQFHAQSETLQHDLEASQVSKQELATTLQTQIETLQHDLATSQISKQELATTLQTQIETLQHDLATSQVSKQELATTLQTQIETLQHDLEASQVSKQELATTLQTQIESLQRDLNATIVSKNEQFTNLNAKIQSLQSEFAATQTSQTEEINKFTLDVSKAETEIQSLQSGLKTAQTTRLSEISELSQQLEEAKQNSQSLRVELGQTISTVENENRTLVKQLKQKERTIQELEEQLKPDWVVYILMGLVILAAFLAGMAIVVAVR